MGAFRDRNRPQQSARGLRFGIVVSRFNEGVTQRLLQGARRVLKKRGASKVEVLSVPGAFEIPTALQQLARKKRYDALIALGAVIRGETEHFRFIANEASRGVMEVMLQEGIPVAFGVLTTETMRQALARAGGRSGNKGEEAALSAIEMAWVKKHGNPS